MIRRGSWLIPLAVVAGIIGLNLLIPQADGLAENYERAIANVLVSEGGYSNDRNDPGGPTKWGITIHDVRKYLKPGATATDVKALTKAQALEIYRDHYAKAIHFDLLPAGLDYSVLDYSINAGYPRAVLDLKRTLGQPGGKATPSSDDLAKWAIRPIPEIIRAFNARRMAFQMGLGPRYNSFKRGWRIRIQSVDAISLKMYGGGGVVRRGFSNDILLIPRLGPGKAYEEEDIP